MNSQGFSESELAAMSPAEFRSLVRRGEWTTPTTRYKGKDITPCRGYAEANLAIVPKDYAFEFLLFCHRNPQPCALLDVTEPGDPHPKLVAPEADLRTDLPKYRVFQDGTLIDEPTDISSYWRDNLVAFVIGCSLSFDWALLAANIQFRLIGAYTTSIQCVPAGRFHGSMVVTIRLFKTSYDAVRAVQVSSRHLAVHGPPVHIGTLAAIGIRDIYHPDMFSLSEPIAPQQPGEVAMFWGCGITPQTVALESKVPFMITHCPGHMFVTDKLSEELAVL
jgi:uncharacterized protein YcsI (UPF0317 family)